MCDNDDIRSGLGCYSNSNESIASTEQRAEVNVSSNDSKPTSSTPTTPSSTPASTKDSNDK